MRGFSGLIAAVAVLAAPGLAFGQAPLEGPEARIAADVTFLADDLLEGRSTGQRGYDLAAHYVEARFRAMGLTPGGDVAGASYRQPVTFVTATGAADATLSWTGGDGPPVVWRQGQEVALGPAPSEGPLALDAGAVFVGYGIDAPESGLDDYAGVDARGKIVVVLSGAPPGLPSDVAASLTASKNATAAEQGAVGILIIPPVLGNGAQWNMAYGRSEGGWLDSQGRMRRGGPPIGFSGYISAPAADALLGGRLAAVREQAARGPVAGFNLPGRLSLQSGTTFTRLNADNVAGIVRGTDPTVADEMVVMMAHLDGLPMKSTGDDRINNGAMDNAGGIAVLLEAAQLLAADPPRRSVLFLAVAAEEMGLLGSGYYASNPVFPAARHVGVVNLDMPMLSFDFRDVIAFGAEHSTLWSSVASAAGTEGVTLSPDPMPDQGVFTRSDHYAFVRAGIPSVMLATGYAGGGEALWGEFFASRYHKPADDMSQVFNWSAAARFARLNTAIARGIADAPERPRWYGDSPFGQRFAADQEKSPRPAR